MKIGISPEAETEFSEYFRSGLLVVTAQAIFDEQKREATVRQFGQRLGMAEFKEFFRLYNDGAKAGDLTAEYSRIREVYADLAKPGSKDANRDAMRAYEEAHPEKCVLIPSEDQFYGFSKGANRLAKFVQWVYVPAVKDASKENVEAKNTALGRLLARTVRSKVNFSEEIDKLRDETLDRYRKIIGAQQGALDEISKALTDRLGEWAHPNATARLEWQEDPKSSIKVEEPSARLFAKEGDFEGDIARFGHGLQRSYLLVLLQELAQSDDSSEPTLIMACEEPELYQHPPQAKHLSSVLHDLSRENAQIIVSSHSPYFISGRAFESVRLVMREPTNRRSRVGFVRAETVAARMAEVTGEKANPATAEIALLHQALQPHINEMFFAPRLILVEGLEDIAYLTAWLILTERMSDYRGASCHIVPVNGKSNIIEPLIIAQSLEIPTYVIFDSDGDETKESRRNQHKGDNEALLRLLGGDDKAAFPDSPVWGGKYVQWPTNMTAVLKHEFGKETWEKAYSKATKGLGNPDGSFLKNSVHIADHMAILHAEGGKSATLDRLCSEIIEFPIK